MSWMKTVNRGTLKADLLAGLTGAFIVLPQGVSFAMIAGLPAQYGLYAAIVPPVIAALFGSSMHLVSGPTTAISIIVFSTLSPLADPGSADYVRLALTLTFMAGLFQLAFGLARLGTLINFVSHSVIVGFTAGAAFLIATSQLKHALGIPIPGGSSFLTSWAVIVVLIAPLTAWLPLSAMGGVILFVAFKLIDFPHIKEILRSSRSETLVLLATFLGTLFFEIEFAIYTGVLLSMAIYLTRTSHPHVDGMVPDPDDPGRQLTEISETELAECPQLRILRINGSLFFGAANHVSEILEERDDGDPRHLLIIGYGINFIDVSGSLVLEQEANHRQKLGRYLFLCRLNRDVIRFLRHGSFLKKIGENHLFVTEYQAIARIFKILDKSICRTCTARIFEECQSVNRPDTSLQKAGL